MVITCWSALPDWEDCPGGSLEDPPPPAVALAYLPGASDRLSGARTWSGVSASGCTGRRSSGFASTVHAFGRPRVRARRQCSSAQQGQAALLEVMDPAGRLVTYQLAGTGAGGTCLPAGAARCAINLTFTGRGLHIVSVYADNQEVGSVWGHGGVRETCRVRCARPRIRASEISCLLSRCYCMVSWREYIVPAL